MLNVFLYLNKEEKWKQTTGQDEDENMKIIETYGNYIEKWSNENPDRARWLLKTGWLKKIEDYSTMTTNIVIPDRATLV